ncbi:uncharacterized protein LOC122379055 [Amphibalanus amphitrite]|uniref:uncharacterized protein LOC122379055 n=1 Tax=Amphibalanus amphitrite TaxID=1232801 RepID=UPI001C92874F|nr:uncharacterized protein LOC122379055 [Amphibalanus amphitrite]
MDLDRGPTDAATRRPSHPVLPALPLGDDVEADGCSAKADGCSAKTDGCSANGDDVVPPASTQGMDLDRGPTDAATRRPSHPVLPALPLGDDVEADGCSAKADGCSANGDDVVPPASTQGMDLDRGPTDAATRRPSHPVLPALPLGDDVEADGCSAKADGCSANGDDVVPPASTQGMDLDRGPTDAATRRPSHPVLPALPLGDDVEADGCSAKADGCSAKADGCSANGDDVVPPASTQGMDLDRGPTDAATRRPSHPVLPALPLGDDVEADGCSANGDDVVPPASTQGMDLDRGPTDAATRRPSHPVLPALPLGDDVEADGCYAKADGCSANGDDVVPPASTQGMDLDRGPTDAATRRPSHPVLPALPLADDVEAEGSARY